MRGWITSSFRIVAGLAAGLLLAACGGGTRQDVNEPRGNFPLQVIGPSFPNTQRLAQHTHLVISVRNSGRKPIPDVAVTLCNMSCAYPAGSGSGTSAEAFGSDLNMPNLASASRPVWIVDRPPGPCTYSCQSGGPGGAVTAYSNTWALGHPLAPGAIAKFNWAVTAVQPGKHVVAWEVAAGLNGKAKAVSAGGSALRGTLAITISNKPARSYVNGNGQIVKTS